MQKVSLIVLVTLSIVLFSILPVSADFETQLRKNAKEGDVNSQVLLGDICNGDKDYVEAMKWYQMAAEQGNSVAQFSLGFGCLQGQGIPQNFTKAIELFRMSAEQGFVDAQFALGTLYGSDISDMKGFQDYTKAMKWYQMAAEQGHSKAQYSLGVMYGNGNSVPVNLIEAYLWFSLSAAQGNDLAKKDLSKCRELMSPEQIVKAQAMGSEFWDRIKK